MMPRAEPSESLTPLNRLSAQVKLLGAQASVSEGDDRGITDLLIRGLLDRLPKPNGIWSLDDRAKWLRTAASIFGLVYKANDGEHREINIGFVKQEAANSPVTELGVAEATAPGFIGR